MDIKQVLSFAENFDGRVRELMGTETGFASPSLWLVFIAIREDPESDAPNCNKNLASNSIFNPVPQSHQARGSNPEQSQAWNWKIVHIQAQRQARLYALRQTKQIFGLGNLAAHHPELAEMSKHLESLPPIDQWSLVDAKPDWTFLQGTIDHVEIEKFFGSLGCSSSALVTTGDLYIPAAEIGRSFEADRPSAKKRKIEMDDGAVSAKAVSVKRKKIIKIEYGRLSPLDSSSGYSTESESRGSSSSLLATNDVMPREGNGMALWTPTRRSQNSDEQHRKLTPPGRTVKEKQRAEEQSGQTSTQSRSCG